MSGYNQEYDFQYGQLGPSTAANLGVAAPQLADVRRYARLTVVISGLATETVAVSLATDAGSASAASIRPIDMATGALAAASTLGNGTYYFNNIDGAYSLTFTKSATTDNATVKYSITRH